MGTRLFFFCVFPSIKMSSSRAMDPVLSEGIDAAMYFVFAAQALKIVMLEWIQSGLRQYNGGEVNVEDVVGDKTPGGPSPTPSVDRWGRSARNEFVNTFVFVLCALTASAGVKLNYDDDSRVAFLVLLLLFVVFRAVYTIAYGFAFQPYRSIAYSLATLVSVVLGIWGIVNLIIQLEDARIVIIVSGASLGAMVLAIAGLFYTRDPETYSATLNDNSDYDYSSSYFYD